MVRNSMVGLVFSVLVSAGVALAAGCSADKVDASIGARCTTDVDCANRCLAPGPDFPGGMCTRSCSTDGDCPADAACAARMGGVCLYACRDDGDCAFLGAVDGAAWSCRETEGLPGAPDAGPGAPDAGPGGGSTRTVCLGPGA